MGNLSHFSIILIKEVCNLFLVIIFCEVAPFFSRNDNVLMNNRLFLAPKITNIEILGTSGKHAQHILKMAEYQTWKRLTFNGERVHEEFKPRNATTLITYYLSYQNIHQNCETI